MHTRRKVVTMTTKLQEAVTWSCTHFISLANLKNTTTLELGPFNCGKLQLSSFYENKKFEKFVEIIHNTLIYFQALKKISKMTCSLESTSKILQPNCKQASLLFHSSTFMSKMHTVYKTCNTTNMKNLKIFREKTKQEQQCCRPQYCMQSLFKVLVCV